MQKNSCTFLPQLITSATAVSTQCICYHALQKHDKKQHNSPKCARSWFLCTRVTPWSWGYLLSWRTNPNSSLMKQGGCIPCPVRVSLCFLQWFILTYFSLLSVFAGETTTTVAPFIVGGVSDGQWHSVQVQYYNKVRLIVLVITPLFIQQKRHGSSSSDLTYAGDLNSICLTRHIGTALHNWYWSCLPYLGQKFSHRPFEFSSRKAKLDVIHFFQKYS